MSERLAIIWIHFGPYHVARVRALLPHFDVQAIELANHQRLYGWGRQEVDVPIITLRNGAWEDQNQYKLAWDLWKKLDALQPEILLVPGYASSAALAAALWGRAHHAKTILMSESNYDDNPRRGATERAKSLWVKTMFDAGVVGGKRAASYLCRLGMPAHKIARGYDIVDNGYFASQVSEARDQYPEDIQGPYFLFVGRLAPEKNLSTLLDAHAGYVREGGGWPLVIVGDGPLRDDLRMRARGQIENGEVVFAGHKDVHDLPRFYAQAGCFVLPSIREPWGLVVNEAMASGLPVIVSTRCGCADDLVVDNENGLTIDPESVSNLTAALLRMSQLSEEERASMGSRSKEIISDYSLEVWASEVKRLADMLVDGKREMTQTELQT